MDWSNDGLTALKLRLVRSEADEEALHGHEQELVGEFAPAFVYPIFGEEETIFGYRELEINLSFASGSLAQYLSVEYAAKFPETSTVLADDPEKILYEFIPPNYTKSLPTFSALVESDAQSFKPLGVKVGAYRMREEGNETGSGKGKGKAAKRVLPTRSWEMLDLEDEAEDDSVIYEAYAADWTTPGFKEFHRRMQIFVLLYIEGGSEIDEDDSRWEFITVFERRKRGKTFSYHFVGFVSFYSFFCWPDSKRLRLAQFIILPPFQNAGHGSALYTLSYQNILRRPEITELTVEDPSETFEDMRDKCDLHTLIPSGDLDDLMAPNDKTVSEVIRKKHKLADRQFYRLLEMILLLNLNSTSPTPAQTKAYRLTVKKRLYLFNKEQLLQIEVEERKVKLQETYEGVVRDYGRLTKAFA